jgi:hypothetical protein
MNKINRIEREIYWFSKLERDGYYKNNSDCMHYDALQVIDRIAEILINE